MDMDRSAFHAGSGNDELPAQSTIRGVDAHVLPTAQREVPANAATIPGHAPRSSSGLGRRPFTAVAPVRIRYGVYDRERRATDGIGGGVFLAVALILALAAIEPATAKSHTVKRKQCAQYAVTQAFVVDSRAARGPAFGRCWKRAKAHLLTHPLPDALVPAMLRRIRGCESWGDPNAGGRYDAQNDTSTASGAYQYLDTTWGRHEGYRKARHAPPRIQDWRAIRDFRSEGTTPWAASEGCWRWD